MYEIIHHGAKSGVTGSCHELVFDEHNSLLVDCGLFQGAETSDSGANAHTLSIEFDASRIQGLIVTHVHIDHVGRIPYLLAAGFNGPIFCSIPSAKLLPLVIEDALKVGVTRNRGIIEACLTRLRSQVVPLAYETWHDAPLLTSFQGHCQLKLSPAGHILGSAYATIRIQQDKPWDIVFSGDLGAPYAPLLDAPKSPCRADQLILESTYGDRNHEDRHHRRQRLQDSMERALADGGVVLIPAFSIGRTQELLYEIESIIHDHAEQCVSHTTTGKTIHWHELDIIVDSPLASQFTDVYRELKPYWDQEAQQRLHQGRHPLDFEQLTTIDDHALHEQTVAYLALQKRPAVVIAASGMCAGGRIVNYLKALLGDARNDVVFVGYQAQGTPGRDLLTYHNRDDGYVMLDGQRYPIRAKIWQIGGYSAHAGQQDLVRFASGMRQPPKKIHLVHGEHDAKLALQQALQAKLDHVEVVH